MTTNNEAREVIASVALSITYDQLEFLQLEFEPRIAMAKRITIQAILDNCQCVKCQDAAHYIHKLNFTDNE